MSISEAKISATLRRLDLPPSSGGKGRVVIHYGGPNRNFSLTLFLTKSAAKVIFSPCPPPSPAEDKNRSGLRNFVGFIALDL